MDRKWRVAKLEAVLKREKVYWLLMDGTPVEAYADEILDCFMSVIRHHPHPLLEQIGSADLRTYSGSGSLFSCIRKLCESRERRLNA